MPEKKEQINLKEKERLLTEQERRHIISKFENRDWKQFRIICVIFFLLIFLLSMWFLYLGGIKDAIICFSVCTLCGTLGCLYMFLKTNKLLKLVRKNEIYVKEAVFLDYANNGYGIFEISKNGKKKIVSMGAYMNDKVSEGEKVILVKMGRKYVWIYKAMEQINTGRFR